MTANVPSGFQFHYELAPNGIPQIKPVQLCEHFHAALSSPSFAGRPDTGPFLVGAGLIEFARRIGELLETTIRSERDHQAQPVGQAQPVRQASAFEVVEWLAVLEAAEAEAREIAADRELPEAEIQARSAGLAIVAIDLFARLSALLVRLLFLEGQAPRKHGKDFCNILTELNFAVGQMAAVAQVLSHESTYEPLEAAVLSRLGVN